MFENGVRGGEGKNDIGSSFREPSLPPGPANSRNCLEALQAVL